jgi:hypothetical protein
MERGKHISLLLRNEQLLYNFDEQYLIDFDNDSTSYGVDSSFYYDKTTRCVVVAPYEDTGVVKTYYIYASVDGGDNSYQFNDYLDLSIVTMYPDDNRKEYTGTGDAYYGASYFARDQYPDVLIGPMPVGSFEIKSYIRINVNCLVSIPPAGATIFIGVTPNVDEGGAIGSGDTFNKSIVSAVANVSQVYDIQQLL